MKPSGWAFLLLAVLAVLAVLVLWIGMPHNRSVAETQRELAEALPRGSSLAEVNSYLDANSYSRAELRRAGDDSLLEDQGVDEDAPVIRATIPNRKPDWLADAEIWVYFVFDESYSLILVSAYELGD